MHTWENDLVDILKHFTIYQFFVLFRETDESGLLKMLHLLTVDWRENKYIQKIILYMSLNNPYLYRCKLNIYSIKLIMEFSDLNYHPPPI